MIEEGDNINDKTIKRSVEYKNDDKSILFLDQKFYQRNGIYYPSVTHILSYVPKGKIFIDWIRENGQNSEAIVEAASKKGKQVHSAAEQLLKGEELEWVNKDGSAKYSFDVWLMISKFVEFWEIHQPILIGSEIHTYSDEYKYAGTIDLVVELNGELWILDLKTSNQVPRVYFWQTAAYQQSWNECYDKKITRRGILWLKSHTKKNDKTGKTMKGKGWQLVESQNSFDVDFKSFLLFRDVFLHECEYFEPYYVHYPNKLKISSIKR